MKKIVISVVIIIAAGIGAAYLYQKEENNLEYKTEKVSRGSMEATVTATGTVNAVTTVQVGTQVSGTIKNLYVDYNSKVKKGQILSEIDPATFQAQLDQVKANLLMDEANLKKAQATFQDARRTFERNKALLAKNYIAQSDLDASDTNMQLAQAQVEAAQAQIMQARAAMRQSETNLQNTKILSPVDGIVISRSVDVGQTVAASFQTPTLFTIAQDLTKMQINTSVDEADIGNIKQHQEVRFTVDAYPEMVFKGEVAVIRNAPVTIQNVVTYDVVINVANPELKLKPGMTANVTIIITKKEGVLKVPNSALRFKPNNDTTVSEKNTIEQKGSRVWVLKDKKPERIKVETGISDNKYTEILTGKLAEGDEVIIEAIGKNAQKSEARQPRLFH